MSYCRSVCRILGSSNTNLFNVFKDQLQHGSILTAPAMNGILSTRWHLTHVRYFNKIRRTPYTEPLPFSCADDTDNQVVKVDLSEPRLGFEDVEGVEELDEITKKLISLEFSTHEAVKEKMLVEVVNHIQDHPLDLRSLEVEIAKSTVAIRNQVKHCQRFRHDGYSIAVLKNRMDRRMDALGKLLEMDVEKFNWLTAKLQLKYIAPIDRPLTLSKRETREKVAKDAALAMVERKTTALQKKLEEERVRFDKYKKQELDKIEEELKELGINEMGNLSDTLKALGHEELVPKREEIPTKRKLILEKRLKHLMSKKVEKDDEIYRANNFLTPREFSVMPDKYFY